MKALVIETPNVLKVKQVEKPVIGDYDALCQLLYGATCTGTDLHVIHGNFGIPITYPTIIGHESIGQVVEVGNKVRHYKVGDLITRVGTQETPGMHVSWGGMAQFGIARDHTAMKEDGIDRTHWDGFRVNQVIPEGLIDPLDATMIITWRETLSYVTRMGIGKGAKVLVSGSGANGFSIAKQSLNLEAESVSFIGSEARRRTARRLGIAQYVDYRDQQAVKAFIDGNGRAFDYIIDATGKSGSLNHLLPCLKAEGTIGVYGMDDYLNYNIMPLNADCTFRFYNGGYDEEETHQTVLKLISEGKLDAGAWLDKNNIFSMDNAAKAYDHVAQKKAIKSVVKLTD